MGAPPARAAGSGWSGRRGVNIGNAFHWNIKPGADGRYGEALYDPPWSASDARAALPAIRAAGFDHIRLMVRPGPFLEALDAGDEARLVLLSRLLDEACGEIIDSGLGLLVSLHTRPGDPGYATDDLFRRPDKARLYLAFAGRIAAGLARYGPRRLAIDPFNEPGGDARDFTPFAKRLHETVRRQLPGHAIILTSAGHGALNGLVGGGGPGYTPFDPRPFDAETLFSLHFYEPTAFGHQGMDFTELGLIEGLPWPPPLAGSEEAKKVMLANLAASSLPASARPRQARLLSRLIDDYLAYPQNRLFARLCRVGHWAAANGIAPSRVYLGEFGLPYTIDATSRERWLREVREGAETFGMGWAAFAHDATNMPLTGWSEGRWGAQGPLLPFVSRALFDEPESPAPATAAILTAMPPAPDAVRRRLIDRTVVSLMSAGIWERLGCLFLVGHDLAASLVDWISPGRRVERVGALTFAPDRHFGGNGRDAAVHVGEVLNGSAGAAGLTVAMVRPEGEVSRQALSGLGSGVPALAELRRGGNAGFSAIVAAEGGAYAFYDGSGRLAGRGGLASADITLGPLALFRGEDGGHTDDRFSAIAIGRALSPDEVRRLRDILVAYLDAIG